MVDRKLQKHCNYFEALLKKSKREFENKWRSDFKPNSSLKDFELIKTLGTGAFGRVMLVRHKGRLSSKLLALKVMEKSHIVNTMQVSHTISEIRIMDAVRFEFLIYMEYFFKDNVYLFLVMPFINGGEMFQHLRYLKKFDETMSKFYAAQVTLALEYIHNLGLIHRDLKPENILLDKDGYIKITDYGFCKKIDDQRTYTLCGTPEYLAPEIIMSQGYNKSVDWWALGVLLFEMNAGYPPFFGKNHLEIYEKIVRVMYNTPPHFSKPLKDLVQGMLQIDKTKSRLGLLRNGARDIKGHEWFKALNWDAVLHKKIKPGYKPKVKCEEDTSNFDYYQEKPFRTCSREEFAEEFSKFTVK